MIESMNPLMIHVIEPLRDGLLSFGTIGMLAWIVLKVLAIAVPVIVSVAFYVVWERKLIGWMHVRHGPMYVGWGVLQAFADVFKLLFKEVLQPSVAHPLLFRLAPLIALVPAFAAWAVVPFDTQVVLSNANASRNTRMTSSRFLRISMSMKSMTTIPPMSRRRNWRATSTAASRLLR